jgi:hypothetical protein
MSSQLVGLIKALQWADFKGTPPPGTPWAAQTASSIDVTVPTFPQVSRGKFQLADQVTVTANFSSSKSWRIDMTSWPAQVEQDLLDHEQGHFDITALNARDLFIQLMRLKNSTYTSQTDGQKDFQTWVQMYRDREKKIQKEYDDDTGHSQANVFVPSTNIFTPPVPTKGSKQAKWERLIASAFTTLRSPAESAPDGTAYKVEIMKILVDAGFFTTP